MFTREGNAGVHRHIHRRGSGPGVQPDERMCILWGNVNHNADLSIEVDRRIRKAWCNFRKYTLELYDRSSAPLELKLNAKSRGTRDNAARLRHVEPARVPLRHAAPISPQILDLLYRFAKAQSCRPLDFLSGHASQDGK